MCAECFLVKHANSAALRQILFLYDRRAAQRERAVMLERAKSALERLDRAGQDGVQFAAVVFQQQTALCVESAADAALVVDFQQLAA